MLDEMRKIVDEMKLVIGSAPPVCGFLVSTDVFDALLELVPRGPDGAAAFGTWPITVSPFLPKGTIVPLDSEGKPIPKPELDNGVATAKKDEG